MRTPTTATTTSTRTPSTNSNTVTATVTATADSRHGRVYPGREHMGGIMADKKKDITVSTVTRDMDTLSDGRDVGTVPTGELMEIIFGGKHVSDDQATALAAIAYRSMIHTMASDPENVKVLQDTIKNDPLKELVDMLHLFDIYPVYYPLDVATTLTSIPEEDAEFAARVIELWMRKHKDDLKDGKAVVAS